MAISVRAARNWGLATLILLIVLISFFSYTIMSNTLTSLKEIIDIKGMKLKKWHDLTEIINDSNDRLYDYRLGKVGVIAPILLLIERAGSEIEEIKGLAEDKEELLSVEEIEREIRVFRQAVFSYEAEVILGYRGGASAEQMEVIALRSADNIARLTRSIANDVEKTIAIKNKSVLNITATAQKLLWLALILAIILSVIIAIFMARALSRPIERLVFATKKLAKGDLSYRVEVDTNDEIGHLGEFFNKMTDTLQRTTVSRDYVDNIIKSMIDALIVIDPEKKIQTINKATCDLLGYEEEELIGKPVEMIFTEEEILNEIQESAVLISKDFKIIKANDTFLKRIGLTRKDVINQPCYKITHNRDSICRYPDDTCPIESVIEKGKPCVELHTHLDKDGKQFFVNVISSPVKDKSGEDAYFLHIAKEVKEENEKGRVSPEDLDLVRRLTDELGAYVKKLKEKKIITQETLETLTESEAVKNLEMYYRTKDGETIPVSFSGSIMRSEEGELLGIVGIARDMRMIKRLLQTEKELADAATAAAEREFTKAQELEKAYHELRDTQAMLVQFEKLSALGELGSGVAHELNSPLAGVLSLIRTYIKGKDPDSEEYQDLKDMEQACEHMAKIIKDFSSFTRRSTGELADINIVDVIETTLSFSGRQLEKKGIIIEKSYADNLPLIKGDESQLRQVVLNMVTNARDAISEKGTLKIRVRKNTTTKGCFVEMEFSDTGCGISKEDISNIFNPFFTTKRPGKGVGLGLSITYTIIRNLKGEILVDSVPGKGTTFTIILPAVIDSSGTNTV